MAINKIQGNILSDNLVRGSNLAFQTDLVYIDVTNGRVGINEASPETEFDVFGTAQVSNIRITSSTANGIFYASNDQLALTSLSLTWDGNALAVVGNVTANSGSFSQTLDVTGNLTAGNISTAGSFDVSSIVASGNIQGNNLISNNDVTTSTVTASGNISANNAVISNGVEATTGSYSGNIIANNIQANLDVVATTVTATANVLVANIAIESSGNIVMGNGWITGLADPVANSDAATKRYVDTTIDDFTGNITFSNTTISTDLANADITIEPTGTGVVIIDTNTGLVVPVGNTAQQPTPAATGTIRFNTDISRLEIYDGAQWEDVAANVTNQTLYGDNSTAVFTLDRDTSAAAALVAINGVIQLPGVAYTVAGNQITFAQAPVISDTIDIRFL